MDNQMTDIIENQKPDVYDIAVDTGDGTYWTAEVVHFQQNDNVRKIQVRIPQQGTQLLQQGEAVAWRAINKLGETSRINEGLPSASLIERLKESDKSIQYLFATPPDTQAKLDKAREAFFAYFNSYMVDEAEDAECCSADQHEKAKAVQQALKDIE